MNPFLKEKRVLFCSVLVLFLFLFFSGLSPIFAAGRPIGQRPDNPGNIGQRPDDPGNIGQRPDNPGNIGQKPGRPGDPNQKPHKPDNLNQKPDKLGDLNQKPHKPDNLNQKPDKLGDLGHKPHKPDQLDHKKPDVEKLRAGDIGLQIANDTDFALTVRVSAVDASERVNLAKAKSITLAPHARESVVLTPMSAGKVSLSPMNAKHEVEKDSKILLTINRGKETRRLVVDYAKSAGMIVLGKDLFQQGHETAHRDDLQSDSEDPEEPQKNPDASNKGQIVYVINQTGIPLNYNALLKPAGFDSVQGELKPGANVLKFPAKKVAQAFSKEPVSLILQMKYDLPGSPAVNFKKEALDLDSHPTVTITRTIMGEPKDQTQSQKKPR